MAHIYITGVPCGCLACGGDEPVEAPPSPDPWADVVEAS